MAKQLFFIQGDDGAEYGPADLLELREWALENRVGLGTLVREDTTEVTWRPWQEFPELVALLAQVQSMRRNQIPPDLVGLEFAPAWRRLVSWVLDILLIFLLITPLFWTFITPEEKEKIVLGAYNNLTEARPADMVNLSQLLFYPGELLYFTLYLAAFGLTPAKRFLNIRVVDEKGRKPSFYQAFIRTLAFMLSMHMALGLPVLYLLFQPQRRAFHDLIAGTYVVRGRA